MMANWERIIALIEPALEYTGGTHTIEDVLQGIKDQKLTIWVGVNCVAVTEIVQYPRQRHLHYFLLGGDMDELLSLRPGIEAWGRACGCTHVAGVGRPGWERVLKDMRRTAVCMLKEMPS